ncbi:MAG: hypothetical protein WEC59_12545, partial [Salibacteraceae bacterium]
AQFKSQRIIFTVVPEIMLEKKDIWIMMLLSENGVIKTRPRAGKRAGAWGGNICLVHYDQRHEVVNKKPRASLREIKQ